MKRKFIHWFFGSLFILFLAIFGFNYAIALIFLGLVFGSSISFLIFKGWKIPIFSKIVEIVEREHEKHLPGKAALLFFSSSLLIMLLFYGRTNIILGAWIVLTYGDGIATVIGRHFGKINVAKNRTLEGTAIGIVSAFFFLQFIFSIPVALITAIIGMFAEFLPWDDNLTIPIISAITLFFLL